MTDDLRPLSIGELLDRTFSIYRRHFLVFVGIAALTQLAPLCVQLLSLRARAEGGLGVILLQILVLWLVTVVAAAVSQAATITAVSEVHLGRSISIGAALASARGRILEIAIISFLLSLYIGLGFILLIVPGVLMALRWAVVIPVVVIERLPPHRAMERSSALTEGDRGRVFLVYIVYVLLAIIVSGIWQVPTGIAVAISQAQTPGVPPPAWVTVAAQVGAYLTNSLAGPLLAIALALLYYDERVRKEAFDLQHMMARLDETAAPTAAPI